MEGALIDMNAQTKAAKLSTQDRLSTEELQKINAYWRACNYLAAGMIYLRDNPLLREPSKARAHQEPAVGTLGLEPRAELRLHSPEPAHQEVRP